MTYYLQFGITDTDPAGTRLAPASVPDPRLFLDDHMHTRAKLEMTIEANSWLDARRQIPG